MLLQVTQSSKALMMHVFAQVRPLLVDEGDDGRIEFVLDGKSMGSSDRPLPGGGNGWKQSATPGFILIKETRGFPAAPRSENGSNRDGLIPGFRSRL
ncbi:MAG: hypothetical protein R3D59_08170 [Paracoccaceae bacterium]